MKKIILIMALILSSMVHAEDIIPRDKFNHAFVGLGIYAGCFLVKGIGESLKYDMDYLTPRTCLIPVIVAGVGKEIYDANYENHTSEWQDAVATIAIPLAFDVIVYEW